MSTPNPARGRIAAIDYGSKRIGIATADLEMRIASPLATYHRQSESVDAAYFRRLAKEELLLKFVVGLPVHNDGRESASSQAARQFGDWLATTCGLPVVYFDERYTSTQAEQILNAAKLTKKNRKARIDKLAAQILLTAYLESPHPEDPPKGLE